LGARGREGEGKRNDEDEEERILSEKKATYVIQADRAINATENVLDDRNNEYVE
jgi:hypothetical protein